MVLICVPPITLEALKIERKHQIKCSVLLSVIILGVFYLTNSNSSPDPAEACILTYSDLRFRSSVMPSVSQAGETAHRRQRYALESSPHFHSIRSVGGTFLAKRPRKSASPMRYSRL